MKWILSALILMAQSATWAAELYKPGLPTRCLAMGTTCISHVGGAESLFINSAALARVDGFDFIVAQAEAGASKDAVDFSRQFQGSTFSASDLNKLYGKTLTADITARSGFVMPFFGFGVFSNNYTTMQFNDPTYPTFHMNFISDYGYVVGGALPLGPQTSLGLSVHHVKRWGGNQDIAVSTVIGSSSKDLANKNFQDHGVGLGMDVSFLTTLDVPLKPTLTFVWQDIGVTTFSLASGNQPPPTQYDNLSFGASIEQQAGIFSFTHAFEYKYIRTEGYDLSQKLHLGTEASVGPLDLRAGISQGYLTYGFGLDLWLFQIDAAAYATELGTYAGQSRSDRYNISITFDIDLDQSFKLKNTDGKKRRLKQRR